MRDPQQQKKLLTVLLVVLALSAGYRYLQLAEPGRSASSRATDASAAAVVLTDLDIPLLDLEALRGEAATYEPGRNPFRFGEPPPAPKQARKRQPPPKRRPRATEPVQVSTPVPETPSPRPKPPAVDFIYLGSFGPEERRIAVFVKDEEIHNALAGDVLLDRFIVDKIGFESADIKFVGFPDAPEKRLEAGG